MRPFLILLIVVTTIALAGTVDLTVAQVSEELGGPGADVDCADLQSVADAQELFDTTLDVDGRDIYRLASTSQDDSPCDGNDTEINVPPLATCANLRRAEHAAALFRAGGADDPYRLDPNDNGRPCDRGQPTGSDPEPTPTPTPRPPSSQPTPTPSAGPCDSTRVENGRAVICAGGDVRVAPFAGFDHPFGVPVAASAAGGFGRAPDSTLGEAIRAGVQQAAPTGGVASFQQPSGDGGTRAMDSEQQVNKRRSKSQQQANKRRQRTSASQNQRERERPGSDAGGR